jgi:hypothetical protein
MKVKLLAGLLAVCISLFFACSKENTDTTIITENPVRTDTVQFSCDSLGSLVTIQFDSMANPMTATLTARMIGGVAPFKYRWSTGDTLNAIRVSSDGTYTVNIIDANGCKVSFVRTVTFPNLCANFRTQITQTLGTTLLTVNVTGGTAPYSYRWSTGATTPTVIATANGTYNVTVTDRNNCMATHQITINVADCSTFKAFINVVDTITPVLGWVAATGGTAPYSYLWSTGDRTVSTDITTSNVYRATVTDARGCTAQDELNISISTATCGAMTLRLTLNPGGAVNGTLVATPALGSAPYTYRWAAGETTNAIPTTSGNLYKVTVTDARGCSISGQLQR